MVKGFVKLRNAYLGDYSNGLSANLLAGGIFQVANDEIKRREDFIFVNVEEHVH